MNPFTLITNCFSDLRMKIKHIGLLLLLVAGTLIAGCSPSENVVDVTTDALSFNSEYAGNTSSLTWAQNSKIGIFEKKSGQTLSESSIVDGLSNIPYQTIGNGIFTHTTRPLTYPQDGSAVDFIAYAPFSDTLRSYQISVDVSQQTGNPWLNLLASNNIVARTNTKQPTLRFKRALGKVTLTINSTDGGDISGLAATLFDMPTSGTFDLRNNTMTVTAPRNGTIPMTMTGSKFTRTATAYVLPQQLQALKVRFTAANGLVREVTLSPSVTVNSDNALKQDVTISGLGSTTTVVAGKQHWTETPLITSQQSSNVNLRYIEHFFARNGQNYRNYAMLYDTDLKMAYWVAYPLCTFYTQRNTGRTDAWDYDPLLSTEQQPTMKNAIERYQRGHQIPSADRYVTKEANKQTFYYSNMTPQAGALNGEVWARLESAVRGWSSNIDTLYVVTGAMPTTTSNSSVTYVSDNSGKKIAVPKYYFKALCRIDRSTGAAYTIAFKFDQGSRGTTNAGTSVSYYSANYMDFALSVSELEELTGFTFFPSIRQQYKLTYDAGKWQ